MKYYKKRIMAVFALLLLINTIPVSAATNVPYDTYNYDYWNDVYYTPAAYVPDSSYSGADLGTGNFNKPQDLYVSEDGRIYIADTGNNRIVVLKADYSQDSIID